MAMSFVLAGNALAATPYIYVDGVTYPANATGINNAIQALPASPTGGTVYLPCTGATLTSSIVIDRPVILRGCSQGLNNRGTLLVYTGSGTAIDVTNGSATGVILENFSLDNQGTGTVGIDIDNGNYDVVIRDVTNAVNTAFSTAFIRIGNSTTAGMVSNVSLERVRCSGEKICVQNLRAISTSMRTVLFDSCVTMCVQLGDSTHKAIATTIDGGSSIAAAANTDAMQILNAEQVTLDSVYWEQDGTGYIVDIPSTTTLALGIVLHGGRTIGASYGHNSSYIVNVNMSGAQISVLGLYAAPQGYSTTTYFVRNQAAQSVVVGYLTAGGAQFSPVSSHTSAVTDLGGHDFSGTLNGPVLPSLVVNGTTTFNGNVSVNGTLSKQAGSFRIDHPLDPNHKFLQHSFVESPDMMNVYNGVVKLDNRGRAEIQLPDYFQALNRDYRYQLTGIGQFAPLYIATEIKNNRFTIAGGKPGMRVSWQVTGIRQDDYANQNRIQVEVAK